MRTEKFGSTGCVADTAFGSRPGFNAVVEAVNSKARCRPADPADFASNGGKPVYALEIIIDNDAEPRDRTGIMEHSLVDQLKTFAHRSPRVE